MNEQPISGQHLSDEFLIVHSVFFTIQGEGPFVGRPAIFIRLGGCNLQCPLCDTDYTEGNQSLSVKQVVDLAMPLASSGLVVITGGEPFRQRLHMLIDSLLFLGYDVQIETNGTMFQDIAFEKVTVVCSPKGGHIHPSLAPHINALKYVLHADEIAKDGLPVRALGHPVKTVVARPPLGFRGLVYVQPIDVGDAQENARHLQATIESAMQFDYRLCLQTHKIIGLA